MTTHELLARVKGMPPGSLIVAGWVAEELEKALAASARRAEGHPLMSAQEPRGGAIVAAPPLSAGQASNARQPRSAAQGRAS